MRHLFFIAILFLAGCSQENNPQSFVIHTISGRDRTVNSPIFRVKTPATWLRLDSNELLEDTTVPLCTFNITEKEQTIRITVHSFPFNVEHQRVPANAQVERWKSQLSLLHLATLNIKPHSAAGFTGLLFEGPGIIAFAMQLAQEHASTLDLQMQLYPEKKRYFQQMRCDYTIKATGPKDFVAARKREILQFANSFELIDEIGKKI